MRILKEPALEKTFEENGWVLLENFLSNEELVDIKAILQEEFHNADVTTSTLFRPDLQHQIHKKIALIAEERLGYFLQAEYQIPGVVAGLKKRAA